MRNRSQVYWGAISRLNPRLGELNADAPRRAADYSCASEAAAPRGRTVTTARRLRCDRSACAGSAAGRRKVDRLDLAAGILYCKHPAAVFSGSVRLADPRPLCGLRIHAGNISAQAQLLSLARADVGNRGAAGYRLAGRSISKRSWAWRQRLARGCHPHHLDLREHLRRDLYPRAASELAFAAGTVSPSSGQMGVERSRPGERSVLRDHAPRLVANAWASDPHCHGSGRHIGMNRGPL